MFNIINKNDVHSAQQDDVYTLWNGKLNYVCIT